MFYTMFIFDFILFYCLVYFIPVLFYYCNILLIVVSLCVTFFNIGFTTWYTNKPNNNYNWIKQIVHSSRLCLLLFKWYLAWTPDVIFALWPLKASVFTTWVWRKAYCKCRLTFQRGQQRYNRISGQEEEALSHRVAHTPTHTHKQDVFHIPGLFVSLFWLLEMGSECWLNVWNADRHDVALPYSSRGVMSEEKRRVIVFAWLHRLWMYKCWIIIFLW